jgi:hypothetical protein
VFNALNIGSNVMPATLGAMLRSRLHSVWSGAAFASSGKAKTLTPVHWYGGGACVPAIVASYGV